MASIIQALLQKAGIARPNQKGPANIPVAHAESDHSIAEAIETLQRADPIEVERLGFRLEPCNYYSPVNSLVFLQENQDLWARPFVPLDIDWRVEHQLGVAREIAKHIPELAGISASPRGAEFYWDNNFWNNADALVQYGLLRSRKPRRLIEVGCGFSSLLAAKALNRNRGENPDAVTAVTLVEPYPRPELLDNLPRDWTLIRSILQRCPLELFDALEDGDVLFYDGSHCARAGSDVNWFFFRVLPRLKPGVLIHLHDMFFPNDYPTEWLLERRQSWNEQFLLQAFLMHNTAYRIEISNSFLTHACADELKSLYGDIQPFWGCSFWMLKTGDDN
jgi:hypothetical protein